MAVQVTGDNRRESVGEGWVERLSLDSAEGLELKGTTTLGRYLPQTVNRVAERVDDATQVAVTDGNREDLAGATHRLALLDPGEVTKHDDTDFAGVEVQGQATGAVLELEQLVGHDGGQAADAGDAVAGLGDSADLLTTGGLGLVVRHEALQRVQDLVRTDRTLRHHTSLSRVCSVQFWCLRSEEHTSELQSLMRNSSAVFCLKKKKNKTH